MENIVDYLKSIKDLLFEEKPFNELDALVLSRLSYIDFRSILKSTKYWSKKKLTDVINEIFIEKEKSNYRFRLKEDMQLLDVLRSSLRYRECYIKSYVYDTVIEEVKQFSAVTFINEEPKQKFMFIAFKGTDGTVTGRKEDFNMAYLETVPAQIEAAKYLKKITRFSSYKTIYVGGHSKGGNLAVYAASQARKNIQNNIKEIYSFDGPGFKDDFLETEGFINIHEKISLFAPQSSIIGRLLSRNYKTYIVQSKKKLLYQHNIYNWKIENNDFVKLDKFTFLSNKIDKVLKDSLSKTTIEERKAIVDELFDIVKDLSKDDVIDFGDGMLDFFKRFKNTFKGKSKETQELILALFTKSKEESPKLYVKPIKNESTLSQTINKFKCTFARKKAKNPKVIDYIDNDTKLIESKESPLLLVEDKTNK